MKPWLKHLLWAIVLIVFLAGCGVGSCSHHFGPEAAPEALVSIDTTYAGLKLYFPKTDSIALRCFDRPVPEVDPDIFFCCAAAFTLDYETEPDHKRICSAHVSEGHYYPMPRIKRNTGAFVTSNGEWKFLYDEGADPSSFQGSFENAATYGGAGFAQEMMIHNGKKVNTTRPPENYNLFRALCKKGDQLCVADATESKTFGAFIDSLIDVGITEAIYMDMGGGWNYSWYREFPESEAVYIHSAYQACATNWLVFVSKD